MNRRNFIRGARVFLAEGFSCFGGMGTAARVTVDFDTTRNCELDVYIRELRKQLETGWCDFTGDVLIRKRRGVPLGRDKFC